MLGWKPKKGIPVPVEPKTGAYWSQVKHTSHERCFFGPEINRRPSFLRLNSSESVASNIWIMLLCCCTSWSLAYQQNCDIGTKLRLNCSLSAPFQQAAALREMEKRGRTCSCCVYQVTVHCWALIDDAFFTLSGATTRTAAVATAAVVVPQQTLSNYCTTPIATETLVQCEKWRASFGVA